MRRPSPSLPLVLALLTPAVMAQPAPEKRAAPGVGLTVYSAPFQPSPRQPVWNPVRQRYEVLVPGFAVVKDWRKIKIEAGGNAPRFPQVAQEVHPTTPGLQWPTAPAGTPGLEQNCEY